MREHPDNGHEELDLSSLYLAPVEGLCETDKIEAWLRSGAALTADATDLKTRKASMLETVSQVQLQQQDGLVVDVRLPHGCLHRGHAVGAALCIECTGGPIVEVESSSSSPPEPAPRRWIVADPAPA